MAMNNLYNEMYRNEYGPERPSKPRKRKVKRYVSVSHKVGVNGKNVAAVVTAAEKVLAKNPKLTMKDLKTQTGWSGTVHLEYKLPESDEDFNARKAAEDKWYDGALKHYEEQKKAYDKYLKAKDLTKIKSAVGDHEAAVNTLAEVLKKYPDILEKAVAKASK
jgi:hypothetical protein